MKQLLTIAVFICIVSKAQAQSVSINTDGSIADASSLLDVKSTGKGVLIPRMSKAQKNAIPLPATGLLVFQDAPDSTGFYYYNGSNWLWLATASNIAGWKTTGNSGTDTAVNFIGTTDNMPLRLKQNNQWLGQLNANNQTYFIGQNAGIANTTAIGNVAFGGNALKSNAVARRNTVIGDSAMYTQSFANGGAAYDQDNTAIGSKTLFFNQPTSTGTGAKNTAVGSEALYFNTTGAANTAVGTGAMHDNTTGAANTAVGRSTHRLAGSGSFNSYFGYQAGFTDSTGTQNTGIGANTLASSYGVNNTAVGYSSLFNDTTGSSNTAIGVNTGVNLRSGNSNFFGGVSAGGNMIGGNNNVALGAFALAIGGVTQNNNVAIGAESLLNNAATGNTAVGYQSLRGNTSGIQNTGIGLSALLLNSSGGGNTAVGNLALSGNISGFSNTALGASSMLNTTGSNNTGMGFGSLNILTTGTFNTAMGDNAGVGIGSLINTTAVGARARVDTSNAMVLGSIAGVAGATANTSVAIGVTKPAPSALLELSNTTKGTLLTRMSKTQRNAIASPATGLMVYQNAPDSTGFYYYNGTAWLWMATANSTAPGWSTTGNAGTDTSVNFVGTTTNMPLRFKVNNNWVGQLDDNSGNFFIGSNSGKKTTGTSNTGMGTGALSNNTTGGFNVAIGANSLLSNTTASQNIALGNLALSSHKTGDYNIAIGSSALQSDTASNTTVAIGGFSLANLKNAQGNTAIGYSALSQNRMGFYKTAVGFGALDADTSQSPNTGLGAYALVSNTSGKSNVAVGADALSLNLTGNNNVAVGIAALQANSFSSNNTAVGDSSLVYNSSSNNSALGAKALYSNTSGFKNTALGYNAMFSNTTGLINTAVGSNALESSVSTNSNVAVGYSALAEHKTGSDNVAVGTQALPLDTSGFRNVAIGSLSMQFSTAPNSDVAVGYQSLRSHKTGSNDVAVGTFALKSDTSGNYNVGVGTAALLNNSNGQHNVGIGYDAGISNTTGFSNTFIGSNSDAGFSNLVNSSAIGYQAQAAQNNSMVLGSIAGVNSASSSVNVGIGTNTPDARLHIMRNGASGGTYHASAGLILEDNNSSFIQLSNPVISQSGILSGNALTAQRSGIIFEADSSMSFSTGGSSNRVFINKTGNLGVNQSAPSARLHVVGGSGVVAGGQVHGNTVALIENNTFANYLQMLSPVNGDAGVISGTSATSIRSGLLFNFDSSLRVMTGGGLIRMIVNNTGLVGIRTITPASYLDVVGSVGNAISTSTASTTLDEFDHTHIILPTASGVLITLPAASTCARREYTIVNEDNSVQAVSSYIDFTGASSITLLANTSITLQSNGTSWYRIR